MHTDRKINFWFGVKQFSYLFIIFIDWTPPNLPIYNNVYNQDKNNNNPQLKKLKKKLPQVSFQ